MKNKNRLTSGTTPAIARIGGEYKVSPYGPEYPDKDAAWCDDRAEAERVAAIEAIEPREILKALNAELNELRTYLCSPKFHTDRMVNAADVLTRLETLRSASERAGTDRTRQIVDGEAQPTN